METPNEMVGLCCRGYPLNDPPQFLSSLTIPDTFRRLLRRLGLTMQCTGIFLAKAVNMVLGTSWY